MWKWAARAERDETTHNAPDEFIANLDKECKANYIQLSVDLAGNIYSLSIPANGHERSYKTRM